MKNFMIAVLLLVCPVSVFCQMNKDHLWRLIDEKKFDECQKRIEFLMDSEAMSLQDSLELIAIEEYCEIRRQEEIEIQKTIIKVLKTHFSSDGQA